MFSPEGLAQNAAPAKDVASILVSGNSDLILEPKMDGFRMLAHVSDAGIFLFTRTASDKSGFLPSVEDELLSLPPGTWLDGEIVAFDSTGMPEWGKVQTVMGSNLNSDREQQRQKAKILTFVVFDLLAFDGNDIRALPFSVRRQALETVFHSLGMGGFVRLASQLPATDNNHQILVDAGWEGSIVKSLTSSYASGKRGHGWFKLKANDLMDVVIMGFKPGENSFTGMIGAVEFGQYKRCPNWFTDDPRCFCGKCENGKVLVNRGRCSGMDMKTRQWMTDNQSSLIGQVISLAYMGIMPSGSPRHPQFKMMRDDKPALDCDWV